MAATLVGWLPTALVGVEREKQPHQQASRGMSVTKPLVQVIDYDGQHKDYIVTKTTVMDVVGTTIP